jgi:thermitase
MNTMKQKKFGGLLLMGLLLAIGLLSFQLDRGVQKRADPNFTGQHLRSLNNGQPFRYQGPRSVPGQVLVKFKPTFSAQSIQTTIAAYETRAIRKIPRIDVYQLQTPSYYTVDQMVAALRQNPNVQYAEPNYIAHICVTPNDEFFSRQWALNNPGGILQIPGTPQGTAGADIKASAAWEETKGDTGTVIAVLDTGVDLLHPDIKNKIVNSGRDFVNNDFDATDDNGHGTHVAGIAAAETNNQIGIAGVAWNCKVLPIKVIDKNGSGLYSWLIDGIIYAADNGAQVINMSLGGSDYSDALKEATAYAFGKGLVEVAAVGNDGGPVLFPAAFDDYVLAVAATDYTDSSPSWSNVGSQVDVAAPGVDILSLVPTWYFGQGSIPYGFGTGTSAAAPHVSGLAALIKSLKPWLKPAEIMNIIRYSADDVNSNTFPGKDDHIGYGRINMEKTLVPRPVTK